MQMHVRNRICLFAVAFFSCELEPVNYVGKTCKSVNDCPEDYVCARIRSEVPTCELLRAPRVEEPASVIPADYCRDVKPLLDRSCVSTCHGANPTYAGSPKGFRLDYYESTDGGLPGVKAQAQRVVIRSTEDTMPPSTATEPRISSTEREVLTRWIQSGAPECLDGGT